MRHTIGNGYFGTSAMLISTANLEVIQQHKPATWDGQFTTYKFAFNNAGACQVKINGSDSIYLAANQGFTSDYYDQPIYSFVIVTNAINYNYIGAY